MAALLRAERGPGRVTPEDYFYYRLFDPALSEAERARFAGQELEGLLHTLVRDPEAALVAHDKCRFEATLRAAGLPTPRTLCLYQTDGDDVAAPPDGERINDRKALARWLAAADTRPLHGKPRLGIRSTGALALRRTGRDRVELHDGRQASVRSVVKALAPFRADGYLFQERLAPDPAVAAVVGPAIASLRLVVLTGPDGPRLFRAAWKLPVGGAVADNFWRGNLLAGVDTASGEVVRAVSGPGPADRTVAHHPDTGHPLVGLAVPRWHELVALTLAASHQIPGLDMQAWDVAATDTGPVLLEVNIGGDYSLPQLALNRGMLEPELITFLAGCARRRGMEAAFSRLGLAPLLP